MSREKSQQLYCPIRCEWVAAEPEEYVRQRLLAYMMEDLGYPKGLIVVEKALNQLPHLQTGTSELPDRRVDILAYGKEDSGSLFPLLLIECKAVPLNKRVINQVVGYNHHLGARVVAVVNAEEVLTGTYDVDRQEYLFVSRLPSYAELSESYPLPRNRD